MDKRVTRSGPAHLDEGKAQTGTAGHQQRSSLVRVVRLILSSTMNPSHCMVACRLVHSVEEEGSEGGRERPSEVVRTSDHPKPQRGEQWSYDRAFAELYRHGQGSHVGVAFLTMGICRDTGDGNIDGGQGMGRAATGPDWRLDSSFNFTHRQGKSVDPGAGDQQQT